MLLRNTKAEAGQRQPPLAMTSLRPKTDSGIEVTFTVDHGQGARADCALKSNNSAVRGTKMTYKMRLFLENPIPKTKVGLLVIICWSVLLALAFYAYLK